VLAAALASAASRAGRAKAQGLGLAPAPVGLVALGSAARVLVRQPALVAGVAAAGLARAAHYAAVPAPGVRASVVPGSGLRFGPAPEKAYRRAPSAPGQGPQAPPRSLVPAVQEWNAQARTRPR
jgi:hypothetical protein